jgi:hypothetical protein
VPHPNVEGTFASTGMAGANVEEFDKKGTKVAVMMGTAEDKSYPAWPRTSRSSGCPTRTKRIAFSQPGREFLTTSGERQVAQTNKQFRLIIPSPVINLEGTAFAIRKGYFYDDLQALDIMVENYANTGQLKAAQAKYGLPNPAEFTK